MTVPLPGGWADELLWHMNNCAVCVRAKMLNSPGGRCARAAELVRLTLNERHGAR